MKGGRARWRIENETFKTLKHAGYNFQHNYGHGKKNLSTNFALLMFLAFLIDQVQEFCCPLFKKAKEVARTKRELWEKLRNIIKLVHVSCYAEILNVIISPPGLKINWDTS